ncbi:MAG: fumarylacetoacetase [Comamonadaceae bacterium]|nr:fumarylacetoacetase [Comamonadaceae bacterium]
MALDFTHEPAARSWLASANDAASDFPLQNLPFAVLRPRSTNAPWRGAVAIGNQALDLAALARTGLCTGAAAEALQLAARPALNDFMAAGADAWRALRQALFALLEASAPHASIAMLRHCLLPLDAVEYTLPSQIGDYTDFYTSIHHARNVGRVIRPHDPLTPNFQWLPIAYHGRASSVVISGTPFHRPHGQAHAAGAAAPIYTPCTRLDYELEMGFFIGPGNPLGRRVPLAEAEQHIFGMCLLNDWSARDHQFWEMDPLGPFLGKNFCTSLSPWVVTMDALAPYRTPLPRSAEDPPTLAYLDSAENRAHGGIDVQLAVHIETAQHRALGLPPAPISRTSLRHQYWTLAQMLTQHSVGGCNLRPGDLCGTGTVSGPLPEEAGALVELSLGGTQPITLAGTGETRAFLADGDAVMLSGWCEKPGAARIGFGSCQGQVLAAI